jgi:hypothetical protein
MRNTPWDGVWIDPVPSNPRSRRARLPLRQSERLARSGVESEGDSVEVTAAVSGEIGALGEELA